MSDNPCYGCGCWDSDREGCTMPSIDRGYACKLQMDELLQFAYQFPYSLTVIANLWDEWGDFPTIEKILQNSLVSGSSPDLWSNAIDTLYRSIDRENNKAIAELQLILLKGGWY